MRPLNVVIGGLTEIGEAPFTIDQILKPETQVSVKFIPNHIIRLHPQAVTSIGIIIPQNGQIEVVVYGKIVPSVLKEEPPVVILAYGRNDES